jgi:hypothetical protein
MQQPLIQWVPGAVSPGAKRKVREADHSPPASAEVKNGGAIPSLPHTYSWRDPSSIKDGDNFNLTYLYPTPGAEAVTSMLAYFCPESNQYVSVC